MVYLSNRITALPPRRRVAHCWLSALQQFCPVQNHQDLKRLVLSALGDFYRYLDGKSSVSSWDLQVFFDDTCPSQVPPLQDIGRVFISLRSAFRQTLTSYDLETQAAIMEQLDAWTNSVVVRYDLLCAERARKREAEIARQMAELNLLNHCAATLNASLDLVSVFNATAQLAYDLTHADLCAVYQREGGYLHPKASAGLLPPPDGPVKLDPSQPIRLLIVDEQRQDIPIEQMPQHCGIPQAQAITCIPLQVNHDTIGSLVMVYTQPQRFTSHQIRVREIFASHAAQAVYNAQLFERLGQLTLSQERRRIACEMHDTMLQTLVSLNINLQVALSHAYHSEWEQTIALIQEARHLGKVAMQEGRDTLSSLRENCHVHEDLMDSLRPELDLFTERTGIKPELIISNGIQVSQGIGHQLCRIVGEVLTNIYRHARATQVCIIIEPFLDELRIQVRDDGVGFDPQAINQRNSFGLIGMRERSQLINGHLTIESAPGQGTTVEIRVLLKAEPKPGVSDFC